VRMVNGSALPVLEAHDPREQALGRAAGLRNAGSAGVAQEPLFRLAGFVETRSTAQAGAEECSSESCADALPPAGQNQ
jgi:hypothetical protein